MNAIQLDLFPLTKGHGYTNEWYDETLLRIGSGYVFVFGDNSAGYGKGGQACIRDEENAYGFITKKAPDNRSSSFLYDHDDISSRIIDKAIERLYDLSRIQKLIFPAGGLGTGLSRMDQYAPNLLHRVDTAVSDLICLDYRTLR